MRRKLAKQLTKKLEPESNFWEGEKVVMYFWKQKRQNSTQIMQTHSTSLRILFLGNQLQVKLLDLLYILPQKQL